MVIAYYAVRVRPNREFAIVKPDDPSTENNTAKLEPAKFIPSLAVNSFKLLQTRLIPSKLLFTKLGSSLRGRRSLMQ